MVLPLAVAPAVEPCEYNSDTMKTLPWLLAALLVSQAAAIPALAQAQHAPPVQFTQLGELKLQSGAMIHDFRLGYRTIGTLNAERSNAVLWPTWLGGTTEDLVQFVGPGNVIDSSKYFVVLVDAIGNGISSSPSNSKSQPGGEFPRFTIRDMVESERRLLTEVLHIQHVRAVMGVSMGGMQSFEWGMAYPEFMDMILPVLGSPQSTSYDKLLWTTSIRAIELDPAWHGGHPTGPPTSGLILAHLIELMALTTPDYRVANTPPAKFAELVATESGSQQGNAGGAWDHIRQRQAIIDLDMTAEFGASLPDLAKRLRPKLLVIVSPQDHMVNPNPAQEFAAAIGAPVVLLDSTCGHLSLSCISVGPVVSVFLRDPASVKSQTMHEKAKP